MICVKFCTLIIEELVVSFFVSDAREFRYNGKIPKCCWRGFPAARNSFAILKNFAASGRVRRPADRLPGSLGRSCNRRTEAQRSLAHSSSAPMPVPVPVQQEKMARFLALFLTAAYECTACICWGHGSGCVRASELAPVHASSRRERVFMKRSRKTAD